jgi:hypothetical protein
MEKSRLRINNEVASNVLRNEGYYVRYPDIKATISLLDDGVHINELGSTYYWIQYACNWLEVRYSAAYYAKLTEQLKNSSLPVSRHNVGETALFRANTEITCKKVFN